MALQARLRFWLAVGLWVSALGCGGRPSLELQPMEQPVEFVDEVANGDLVLKPGATILIGEIHGTWETPVVVASLVKQAAEMQNTVVLCVELPSSEQAAIDRFLNSNGESNAKHDLLSSSFWSGQDGRASVGMFAMLELVRRLRKDGNNVQITAIDFDWSSPQAGQSANGRDEAMANNLLKIRQELPDAVLISLTGNVHANTANGAPWNENYTPMGSMVSHSITDVVSLRVTCSGGQAWVIEENGPRVRALKGQDQGDTAGILFDETSVQGFHGELYVGRVSAAKPVLVANED